MKVAKINLLIAIWGIGFASLAAFEVLPEQTSSNIKRKCCTCCPPACRVNVKPAKYSMPYYILSNAFEIDDP